MKNIFKIFIPILILCGLFLFAQGPTTRVRLLDTNYSNYLQLMWNADMAANQVLNFITGTADRTITLTGNPTLADWFDQEIKTTSTPTFGFIKLKDNTGAGSFANWLYFSSVLTANRNFGIITGDSNRIITLSGNPTLADWFDQAVKQASSPTFAGLTLTGFSGFVRATVGVLSASAIVDADVPDTITLTNITQIGTRSHTSLSDIGTLSHATIDTYLDQAVKQASSPTFAGGTTINGDAGYLIISHPTNTSLGGIFFNEGAANLGYLIIIGTNYATAGRRGNLELVTTSGNIILTPTNNNVIIGSVVGNTKATLGLTINQGGNDNEIFSLKSSDVAHAITVGEGIFGTETDTYAFMRKNTATEGGLFMVTLTESTAATSFHLYAIYGDADTTKTTAATGPIILAALKANPATNTYQACDADDNIFVIKTCPNGGSYGAVFIVDEDGDILYDGTAGAFQGYDDIALLGELEDILSEKTSKLDMKNKAVAKIHGIVNISSRILDENKVEVVDKFISTKKLNMLMIGSVLQLNDKIIALETRIFTLEKRI